MVACFNALKISHSTSFPSPKLSLISQNTGSDLDASDSMYIAPITLKTSYLTLYNYLSSTSFFSLFLINFASLLLVFSLN
jgi:hypothetical protein